MSNICNNQHDTDTEQVEQRWAMVLGQGPERSLLGHVIPFVAALWGGLELGVVVRGGPGWPERP